MKKQLIIKESNLIQLSLQKKGLYGIRERLQILSEVAFQKPSTAGTRHFFVVSVGLW